MMPTPSEIERTRVSAFGLAPMRSHAAMSARPMTLRNDSIVSTSQPLARTIFASTSDMPSAVPAAIPGASGNMK